MHESRRIACQKEVNMFDINKYVVMHLRMVNCQYKLHKFFSYFSFQYREERIKKEVEKFRKERPKIQQQFTDLKRELVSF